MRKTLNTLLLLLVASLALLGLPWERLLSAWQLNQAAYAAARGLLAAPEELLRAETMLARYSGSGICDRLWLEGQVARALGKFERSDAIWTELITCEDSFVSLLRATSPERLDWAELALQFHPEDPEAWFWAAWGVTESDPGVAATRYQHGLELNPYDGLRWRERADILRHTDPLAAIQAYLQSCYNGDPGSNGCFGAGVQAERLGLYEEALRYYRLSRWSGSHDRADQLEERMRTGTPRP